ncbi:MAG: acyltransferase domain-containing protein, partial [Acidobacteriia bacterium]|nr:acyltransferase domain-containing protein [Terriglobia bacterium]
LVFKRLADAERDGDRIYAVIKASGSSSDGKDKALTAPRPQGQVRALQRAYAKAGISPKSIGLIEAHGTGTVAGDGAEVQALTQVFSEAEAPRQGCAIGSVKSMIGHTKCSAGAAGLIKATLALHHKVLPPTLGVEKPNARANFAETPFFVNTEARPWLEPSSGEPRRAGVSAFGFGGTNFHIVLEEYAGSPASYAAPSLEWSHELFLWTGESRQSLLQAVETWEKALASGAKPELRDLAYTAWKQAERAGAAALSLAIVASSLDDLKQKLTRVRQSLADSQSAVIQDPSGIYFTARPLASEGKLAFLFPGQGSQYPRMLHDLLLYFPEIRQPVEQAVRVLQGKFERPLNSYIFPPPSFSREEETGYQQALTQTNVAQPALGAVSMAMFELLRQLGLKPDMAAGHSYGEYVALAAAGVFTPETLFAVSEARGRFIVEEAGAEPGIMAAVEADPAAVNAVIKDIAGVCLANANAPRQSVISGTPAAVKLAVAQFTAQGTTARMIPVACAFHSPLVAPAQQRLAQFLSAASMAKLSFSVYSNTTAAPYPEDPTACKELLSQHLVRPVEFVREIEAMYAAGARVFVEVGPRGVLTGLAGEILGDRPKLAVPSNQSSRPGLPQFLHLLGQLAAHGYALKLDRLYQDRSDRVVDLAALPTGQKQLPPSVWLVNGARAKPLKEEMPAQQTARKKEVLMQSSRPPYINGAASAAPAPVPSPVPEPPAPNLPASTPIPN